MFIQKEHGINSIISKKIIPRNNNLFKVIFIMVENPQSPPRSRHRNQILPLYTPLRHKFDTIHDYAS